MKTKKYDRQLKIIISVAVLSAIILGCIYFNAFDSFFPQSSVSSESGQAGVGENKRSDWAGLGDFFGGLLNPILTFLSLLLLVITLRLNLVELSLSRKELALTREEVARSSDALSEQADSLQLQNFESTFFHLLELYRGNIQVIKHVDQTAFAGFSSKIKKQVFNDKGLEDLYRQSCPIIDDLFERESVLVHAIEWMQNNSQCVDHLIEDHGDVSAKLSSALNSHLVSGSSQLQSRVIELEQLDTFCLIVESILTYIMKSENSNQFIKKVFYNELLQSQMSFDETYCLFFVLIGNEKYKNLKELCTEASMFKSIVPEGLGYGEYHMRCYDKKAFGLPGEWS